MSEKQNSELLTEVESLREKIEYEMQPSERENEDLKNTVFNI